ncbi:Uncharacterised protein [Vibrio cholerae]|nr:Uncharacterised protein [Vibrio cholerae]
MYVSFQYNVQLSDITCSHVREHVLQFRLLLTRQFHFAELTCTVVSHFTRFTLITYYGCFITGRWNTRQTQDFNWDRWARFFNFVTDFITHCTNAAIFLATQNNVTLTQSARLNQNSCYRTTAFIQTRFDDHARRHTLFHRFQLKNFSLQQNSFQ